MDTSLYTDLPPVGSVDEWSKILGCHPQSLRRAITAGDIRSVRLGRLIKIPRHAIVAWLYDDKVSDVPVPS